MIQGSDNRLRTFGHGVQQICLCRGQLNKHERRKKPRPRSLVVECVSLCLPIRLAVPASGVVAKAVQIALGNAKGAARSFVLCAR